MKNDALPNAWQWVKLGDMCEEIYRYPTYYNIEYADTGVPEIRGELIKKDGTLENNLTKFRFISEETSKRFPRTVLKEGDFVLSVRGSMGKVAIVPKSLEGANMTANLIRISPSRKLVHSPYLKTVFMSELFQSELNALSPQTTIKTIRAPVLKSILIPLPPLPEQKRIAARIQELMRDVERAHAACEKQLEAARALPSSYLRAVFENGGGKKWGRRKLQEICEIEMGQSPPGNSYNTGKKGMPLLNGPTEFGLVNPSPIQWTTSPTKLSKRDDILLCVRGATVGRKNIADKQYCIGRGLAALRAKPSQLSQEFLLFVLDIVTDSFLKESSGSTFPNLSGGKLKQTQIPFPPLHEQKRIATELKGKMAQADALQSALRNQHSALSALPQAILRKAFRGQL